MSLQSIRPPFIPTPAMKASLKGQEGRAFRTAMLISSCIPLISPSFGRKDACWVDERTTLVAWAADLHVAPAAANKQATLLNTLIVIILLTAANHGVECKIHK